jgi:hypothetical protein
MANIFVPIAAALIAQVQPQAAAPLPVVATGVVADAATGAPIAGALVQQEGSVTSAFTKEDGTFRLLLDKTGQATLSVSAVGYETFRLPIGNGQGLSAKLAAVSGFVPAEAAPNAETTAAGAEAAPIDSGVTVAYRLRRQAVETGGAGYSGLANNDFRVGARFRLRPWLFEAEGAHYQTPVDLAGLSREENPAFSPSTWQAGARVGRIFALSNDLETAASLAYRWSNTSPNNNAIRFTGSDLDVEQTRHAVGLSGLAAWRPNRGPWQAEASLGLYPLVIGTAKAPGAPFANSFLTDARAGVGYEIIRGMRVGVGYQFEDWRGNGSDSSHMLLLNVHYQPGGIPKGDER